MSEERRRRASENLAYADLNARPFDVETTSPNFRVQRLSEFYYGYSATVADIDRDGNMDVVSGPYYYLGPTFSVGRQYYAGVTYNPTSEYPLLSMVNLAYDWTGDGWPDILNMSGNAGNGTGTLYVNPKGENRRWDTHVVLEPPNRQRGDAAQGHRRRRTTGGHSRRQRHAALFEA